jgi:tRNA modification GTPase
VNTNDTVFAIATGNVRAAIAVVRMSGGNCGNLITRLCGRLPAPRRATLCALRDGAGSVLDRALVLWMPGPASYTGEDSAELHLHGGRAVMRAVTDRLMALGARAAEAGEFTRRAFMNGRMDLLEAEGIADLVAAESEAQRRQALRQMEGRQSAILQDWAGRLRRMLSWQEALIDFPDEDLPAETEQKLRDDVAALAVEMAAAAAGAQRGVRLRDGLVVAVVGAPNAGKSSLVNALSGRDVSIVSAVPGTTRDAIEAMIELAGVPVILVDTAGLRATDDEVEAEGVRRAQARAASADIVLHVLDCTVTGAHEDRSSYLSQAAMQVTVYNKSDLGPAPTHALGVSAKTGSGMAALETALGAAAQNLTASGDSAVLTRQRHIVALREATASLLAARDAPLPELRGEDLRMALRALGAITGAVDVESILDTVFGAFCIGK